LASNTAELAFGDRPGDTADLVIAFNFALMSGGPKLVRVSNMPLHSRNASLTISWSFLGGLLLWPNALHGQANDANRARLTHNELNKLWDDLIVDIDATGPFRAICALVRHPDQAVALCKDRMQPFPPADARRIGRLVGDLDSDKFQVRQLAAAELEKLRELAAPALQRALIGKPALEVRQRIEQVLANLEGPLTGERLRSWRVIEVLEKIGTPAAQEILHTIASGAPEAGITQDAREALDRLTQRPLAAAP
jgi:hypothetical protein